MTQKLQSLKKKISKVELLSEVVKMMKNLSASRIIPARKAVESMNDYYHMVKLGFKACLTGSVKEQFESLRLNLGNTGVIVFGSDRGMVGQYNEIVTEYAINEINSYPGEKIIWGIGEKVSENLKTTYPDVIPPIPLPNRVDGITTFVDELVTSVEKAREQKSIGILYVIFNKLVGESSYEPVTLKVLPLELEEEQKWETSQVPDVIGGRLSTFIHLLQEYIFVSFYKVCAESMASENASRLAMMEEAEQNINTLLGELKRKYFHERQQTIDEELFDIITGFEAKKIDRTKS